MLNAEQKRLVLDTATESIRHGVEHGKALPVNVADYPPALRVPRATFVTLTLAGELRGCIGMLEAVRPLITDVSENAYAAAFRDPRFAPVSTDEVDRLQIHVSILSESEPLAFSSEESLIAQLRPGVDGLILEAGRHRGTFLPSVWESLPEPHEFLRHLKLKAGLPIDYWSDSVAVSRYTVEDVT
jgi:AmmeMemoRadiSam system protein A